MRKAALLVLAGAWLTGCVDYTSCTEVVAEYDFALGMLPRSDTLAVNAAYRIDYFGELRERQGETAVKEINPLFTIGIHIYRIDNSQLFPVLNNAVPDFDVLDVVPGTFSGKNSTRINLSILPFEKLGFAGGVNLIPRRPGWYLVDLVPTERFPVEPGSDRSCEKVQQLSYRLVNTNDPFGAYYDELQRANVFKPQTQRLLWVK